MNKEIGNRVWRFHLSFCFSDTLFSFFTPTWCIICDPLDESQWTEVRLAGLEFASTLLRQPWRSYLKPTFFFSYIELYLLLEQSVGSGMNPDPER
jgi:hypothetical protein